MYYYLFDFIITILLNLNISTLLYKIHSIKIIDLILTLIIIYLITENIYMIIFLILIFILNKILYKFLSFKLINIIVTYTIYYLILFKLDASLIINIILVILLYLEEYKLKR